MVRPGYILSKNIFGDKRLYVVSNILSKYIKSQSTATKYSPPTTVLHTFTYSLSGSKKYASALVIVDNASKKFESNPHEASNLSYRTQFVCIRHIPHHRKQMVPVIYRISMTVRYRHGRLKEQRICS